MPPHNYEYIAKRMMDQKYSMNQIRDFIEFLHEKNHPLQKRKLVN
jgi:hypothetical protein